MARSEEFFHGSTYKLKPGDNIEPGRTGFAHFSERLNTAVTMAHVKSFEKLPHHTADPKRHIYSVQPTGDYEPDTAMPEQMVSHKSAKPLKILNEVQIGSHSALGSKTYHKAGH